MTDQTLNAEGRPRIAPVVLTVRVNEATRDGLRARALREGIPMAELLRGLLENASKER